MKRHTMTPEQRKEAVTRYQSLEPMESIAQSFGVSRQAIFKTLKKEGINTGKSQRIERRCSTCGLIIFRRRARARNTRQSFCSTECYIIWLETLGETYKPSNYHSRMARNIVQKYFNYIPEEGHIIHHINKDCSDNRKINLMVFDSQGNHVRYHRGFQITPLWDGRIQ